jgi:hypothetical protein
MPGEYDAASIVGQQAGMDTPKEPLPPAKLIERFGGLTPDDPHLGTGTARRTADCQFKVHHAGYCGSGHPQGYDDGYDFMGDLCARGWRDMASKGDWPFVVYVWWNKDGDYAVAEYCEQDLNVWTFRSVEQARAFVRTLKDCP